MVRERIAIYLTNLGRYNEGYLMGEWVKLPIPKDKLDDVLCRIGIDEEHRGRFYVLNARYIEPSPVQPL